MRTILLNITPVGKPRMTRRDQWWQTSKNARPAVINYYNFKDQIRSEARKKDFKIGDHLPYIIFHMPMPPSWGKKKRAYMIGRPHQQRPDGDNLEKALLDCLCLNDAAVWDFKGKQKVWSEKGFIEIHVE